MVVCLERGAGLHMAQLMPLPLTVSCSSKIQIGFTFLVPAYSGCPGKEAVKWLCVCYKFHTKFNSKRILKIGQYLVKLRARVRCLVFLTHGVVLTNSPTISQWQACGSLVQW